MSKGKKDLKAYILLFSCSVSRALHLELMANLSTTKFIKSLKRLILGSSLLHHIFKQHIKVGANG